MKRRADSFFGLHFDFHANPKGCPGRVGETLTADDIRETCTLLKPDFLQTDCKGHPGWCSYPTKVGNAMPSFAQDPLRTWREVTREEDVALYLHYSGVWDYKYVAEHPGEAALRPDGTPSDKAARCAGRYADDVLIPQLTEAAVEYGVDGFWIDGDCWGAESDFHPENLAAFERETGADLGGKLPAHPGDPYFEEFREFCREQFRAYVRKYVDALHKACPTVQVASNWSYTDHMPERVSSNVDFLSGDLNPENSVDAARYAGRAIAQQERTWDLMAWNFRHFWDPPYGQIPKHPNQILQEAAATIALGGGFQVYVTQYPDGALRMDQIRALKPLADFMRARQPFCFRGKQTHEVGILLSTFDRLRESNTNLYTRNGYEKILGLTGLACDTGHSVSIVSEHKLEGHYGDWKVLIIPETYAGLEPETVSELMRFAENGGSLILCGYNTLRLFEKAGVPCEVGEKSEGRPFFGMDGVHYGTALYAAPVRSAGETVATAGNDIRKDAFPVASIIPYGKGKIAAIGWDIGSDYNARAQYLQRVLFRELLDRLYAPSAVVESADGICELIDLRVNGRTCLQLVNANGCHRGSTATEDYIPPVMNVTVRFRTDKKPSAVLLQPEGTALPFEWQDGAGTVNVPSVPMHEILELVE